MVEEKDEKKPAPVNAASASPKPTTNRTEAKGAEQSAKNVDGDVNAQTGGTAANPHDTDTQAGVAGKPYVENEDFVPNPKDHYGYLDTTGAGVHEDPAGQVNPLLGKDHTVIDTLPDHDKERVRDHAPDYASDGSRIIRPDGMSNKPPAGSGK